MKIDQCIIELSFETPLSSNVQGKDLRGAIAGLYPDESLFHHHERENLIYTYPKIQYKRLRRKGVIVGLEKGATALGKTNLIGKTLRLRDEQYVVDGYKIAFEKCHLGTTDHPVSYRFLSPWIALNEKNYRTYQKTGSADFRRELLRKILIGNILSMCKGIGYTASEQIFIEFLELKEKHAKIKGNPMLAFLGTFATNFDIPSYWGIGKSTSRGFGTLLKVN